MPGNQNVRELTFSNYFIHDGNRLAESAARTAVDSVLYPEEAKKESSRLVYLYGPSGVGKTHLLRALETYVSMRNSQMRVLYTRIPDFMDELVRHCQADTVPAFLEKYMSLDVLLLDDFQYMGGPHLATMNAFTRILDSLMEQGKCVVIASGYPPEELNIKSDLLLDRLMEGVQAAMEMPEEGTRRLMVNAFCDSMELDISDKAVDYIVNHVMGSVWEMWGAAHLLAAVYENDGKRITGKRARKWLVHLVAKGE